MASALAGVIPFLCDKFCKGYNGNIIFKNGGNTMDKEVVLINVEYKDGRHLEYTEADMMKELEEEFSRITEIFEENPNSKDLYRLSDQIHKLADLVYITETRLDEIEEPITFYN